MTKEQFSKLFSNSFTRKLRNSIVPGISFSKKEIVDSLYKEISDFSYVPSLPRAHIVINKHNHVARVCPTFEPKDYFLYFFCTKILEDDIAINRVDGTWGGWRLGNKIRLKEEVEELSLFESAPLDSFNPGLWRDNWQEFQKRAYEYSQENWRYFIKLDIANFYNRINLDLLKRRLLSTIPQWKQPVVELLFHFLEHWNRIIEGYSPKTIGLPQDELSDCSRLLANFYLQSYDSEIAAFAAEQGGRYLRFADDQIIFANDQMTARRILFEASKLMLKSGLDINSGKVIEFTTRGEFEQYWAFELFDRLADPENSRLVTQAAQIYLQWRSRDLMFRHESVLRRFLSMRLRGLDVGPRMQIIAEVFRPEFLENLDFWAMERVYDCLEVPDRDSFVQTLSDLTDTVHFNSFHYNFLRFLERKRIPHDKDALLKEIAARDIQ